MKKYVLAIDQGTTSTRAILIDKEGKIVNIAQKEVACLFPQSGYVETDPIQIWISVNDVINELLIKEDINWDYIDSIGITNQRETTVVWDKKTGLPIHKAIVWQSRQTSYICERYKKNEKFIHQKTGLLINPYFSASKIIYILENVPGAKERAKNGELLFGTIDSWLIYRMTNKMVHFTDVTNASRTMLMNIKTLDWDDELLELFDIPKTMLPKIMPSSADYGCASFFNKEIHIYGVAGDQQAALFGHACFDEGECKNTYGTGCFMLMNTGDNLIYSKNGLLTTVAWQIGDKVTYALEGSIFVGGAVIQWLRDKMHLIRRSEESEKLAFSVADSSDIYIVPAFTGLGTPYWDDDARGAVFGITRNTTDSHFVKASLESIAYQCMDVVKVMEKECNFKLHSLSVDGGATANKYLMQFQSDMLQTPIKVAHNKESTALGAAFLAGLKSGFFENLEQLTSFCSANSEYTPGADQEFVDKKYNGWKKAVEATRMFK